MDGSPSPKQFLNNYLNLCANPLRGEIQLREELRQLLELPMVKHVVFEKPYGHTSPDTLIILLDTLFLTDPETKVRHFIGNFLVYLTRERVERHWDSRFRLVNLDTETAGLGRYMHPHMMAEIDPDTKESRARICIDSGEQSIYQAIRLGNLFAATSRIITVLHTLGPYAPYYRIDQWPQAE